MAAKSFLVTAATGTVGRPLTLKLLAMGHKVHALTTNTDSERARDLARAGATLFKTALDDKAAIAQAAASCTGVYLNPMPANMAEHFSEATFAQNVVDASRAAGVSTCVVQSVENVDAIMSIPEWKEWISDAGILAQYWKMKAATQDAVRSAGFKSWTAIQGGMHMSNFSLRYLDMLFPGVRDAPTGTVSFPIQPSTRLHLIDPADLAELAARALTEPERYGGRAFNAVGEKLTLADVAAVVAKHAGKPMKPQHPDLAAVKAEAATSLASGNGLVLDLFDNRPELDKSESMGVTFGTLDKYLEERQDELRKALA